MTQYGFYFDATRCTACKTCVLACKDYKDLPVTYAFRNVIEYGGGVWEQDEKGAWSTDTYIYNISLACNNCDNPGCVLAGNGGVVKDEETGIVYIADDSLIEDPEIVAMACPYNVPKVDPESGKLVKCNSCMERVLEGKNPICVDACSTRALAWGPIDELRATYGDLAEMAPLPSADLTMPNVVFKAPANCKPVDDETGMVLNTPDIQ